MNGVRPWILCVGCLSLWGCAQLEGPTELPLFGAGAEGLSIPGLIEYAEVTHRIGPIDNPAAIRQLAQTKFRHLTLAYLRLLPEYKEKKSEIVKRAAQAKSRTRRRPDLTPEQRRDAIAEIDADAASEIEALDMDPELWNVATTRLSKRKFFIPQGSGLVQVSADPQGEVHVEEGLWATTESSTSRVATAMAGDTRLSNIDLTLRAVLAQIEDPEDRPEF